MPGFNFFYNIPTISLERKESLITDKIVGSNFQVNRFTLNKFIKDKIFVKIDNVVIVLEGVILNKVELLKRYNIESWEELVNILYHEDKYFFKNFRGSFCGLVYNMEIDECIIFTDQLGTKHLYYFENENSIFISSEISDIYSYFKNFEINYFLDVESTYDLLSYGYMLENNTLCNKIKKIKPGSYIVIKNNIISHENYYTLPLASKSTDLNKHEIIEKIDKKFKNAIKLQFEKDIEYGYQHFVGLSGGLDSRMTSWVAHELGYKNQVNFTFSQSDYLDETIPKKIASDLRHEWIFKALDNGVFLKDLEKITSMTGGNVLYYGLAHSNSMFKLINFENLGVVHTGQLGDIVIGTFIKSLSKESLTKLDGAYSKTLLNESKNNPKIISPEEIEHKLIYQRGINGANNGLVSTQHYTETISPFYDIDFFEFCLSIPIKLRIGHSLYKQWVVSKYPKAGDYIWESTGKKVNRKEFTLEIKGNIIPLSRILPIILYKFGVQKTGIQTKKHMNPLDYWYKSNMDVRQFQDKYFEENVEKIKDEKLKEDCKCLYNIGGAIEKNQVLSLIASNKMFFR